MYIYKEVLSVSNHKGRDIREFAQQGGIYKSIYYMLNVYLWVYEYVNKEVLSGSTRKGTVSPMLAPHRIIYKSIYDTVYVIIRVSVCMYTKRL